MQYNLIFKAMKTKKKINEFYEQLRDKLCSNRIKSTQCRYCGLRYEIENIEQWNKCVIFQCIIEDMTDKQKKKITKCSIVCVMWFKMNVSEQMPRLKLWWHLHYIFAFAIFFLSFFTLSPRIVPLVSFFSFLFNVHTCSSTVVQTLGGEFYSIEIKKKKNLRKFYGASSTTANRVCNGLTIEWIVLHTNSHSHFPHLCRHNGCAVEIDSLRSFLAHWMGFHENLHFTIINKNFFFCSKLNKIPCNRK